MGLLPLFTDIEMPLIEVLEAMEREGVRVDTEVLGELSTLLADEAKISEEKIYEDAGERFNVASPKQLGDILFDKLKLMDKPPKTPTGQYATGEEVLTRLAYEHPIAADILEFRQIVKLKNTYIDSLPDMIAADGRVHTSFNQTVAATGRLSSTNPNLQNIPIRTDRGKEIRKAFVARDKDHRIVSADYSQIELRIMASFSEDATMIQAFKENKDIHAITASRLYKVDVADVTREQRNKAKTANFGIIYGISAFGLAQRLRIPRQEAADIIKNYFIEFPAVKAYMDDCIAQARETEYVTTLLGRRRYLRDINSRNTTMVGMAERNAINAPIQGSAADMIKIAMIRVNHWLAAEKLQTKMILQVHDELVFDAPLAELDIIREPIIRHMADAMPLKVPIEVGFGVGDNWLDAH
jgi:DNA polymerase-1